MLKKITSICALIAVFFCMLLSPINTVSAKTADSEILFNDNEFKLCADNDIYELYVIGAGIRTGEFYVKNKVTGAKWYSNPQNRDFSDSELKAAAEASSQFIVTIYSDFTGTASMLNSFRGSLFGENVSVKVNKTGFTSKYKINNNIKVDINFDLNEKGISVSVDFSKINTSNKEIITEFQLLPYFGAANYGEEGYLFVPDGSGALIFNNTDKTTALPYSSPVYGTDLAFQGFTKANDTLPISMPVFGAKNQQSSLFAVIEKGAAGAEIKAASAYDPLLYNRVYCGFKIVGDDKITLGESGSGFTATNYTYEYEKPITKEVKVSYMLLEKTNGYSEMAELYREYLNLKSTDISKAPSMFLELYGGINRKKSVFGIPLTVFCKLTTVKQAKEISEFFEKSISGKTVVSYRNTDTAVINGKLQNKFRLKRAVGSKKQLDSLKKQLNGELYLENNIFSANRGGNGLSVYSGIASRINRNKIEVNKYSRATTAVDRDLKSDFAVKSRVLDKIYGKYFNSLKKADFNSAFINLANTAYSDFGKKDYISREKTVEIFSKLTEKYGKNGLIYSPNSYAFSFGKYAVDTPLSSSQYDITDVDVPFYQMVLSGTKEYATYSINLNSEQRKTFLKAIESGSALKYTFIYENINDIKNTEYDYLFGADFKAQKNEALKLQKELETVFEKLGSRKIKNHTVLNKDIRVTEFDNGSKAVINLSDKDADTDFGNVPANSYLIINGR